MIQSKCERRNDWQIIRKKIGYAGEILAKTLSGMIIDGHPVLNEFTSAEADQGVIKKSEEWKSKHVCESQYFLQILKCKDSKCCSPLRSSYRKVVKTGFFLQQFQLHSPQPVAQSGLGEI